MPRQSILLIEDSDDIRFLMKAGLERDGYDVTETSNGAEALGKLKAISPDAILLDVMLPDDNGLNLIPPIRKLTDAPVIVVSAKSNLIERVVGFEAGADDYIIKPFQLQELLARVKAHVRRYKNSQSQKEPVAQLNRIKFNNWIMDFLQLQVYSQKGISANLTIKEFRLLEVLILSPRQVFSREQLLDKSRENDFCVTDRAIDTQIARIRKKLGDDGQIDNIIKSVRGVGYFLSETVEINRL